MLDSKEDVMDRSGGYYTPLSDVWEGGELAWKLTLIRARKDSTVGLV